jgi:hypothetical protein
MVEQTQNSTENIAEILLEITNWEYKAVQSDMGLAGKVNKEVVYYTIRLCCGGQKWNLAKRFNEFNDLHEAIKDKHPNLPVIPPKTYFPLKKAADIDARGKQLNDYMKEIVNRADLRSSSPFRSFIQLDNMIAGSSAFSPSKVGEIADLTQGGRDFVYVEEKNLIFVAMSEMKIASRLDSYLTNVSANQVNSICL